MADTSAKLQAQLAAERELKLLEVSAYASREALAAFADKTTSDAKADKLAASKTITDPATGKIIFGSKWGLANKAKKKIPAAIREMLFVRLISTVELFLTDGVRDLFIKNTGIFHDQKKRFEISHAELLSSHSISVLKEKFILKEIRSLHSAGFSDIAKYYEKKLEIRFSEQGLNLREIVEFFDRRHLLVHRMGRADERYRKTYNYKSKAVLSVSSEYLERAFSVFGSFIEKVGNGLANLTEVEQSRSDSSPRVELTLEAVPATDVGMQALSADYAFVLTHREKGESIAFLRDFITSRQEAEDGCVTMRMTLGIDQYRAYNSALKRLDRKGDLSFIVLEQKRIGASRYSTGRPSSLSRTDLERLARALPPEPWSQGIHKQLASQFGISNSECSRAIQEIMSDDALINLIGNSQDF